MIFLCVHLNGYVGRDSNGYNIVHGGYGYGQRNEESQRVLEAADALELFVCNRMFKKHEVKLISYASGGCKTSIHYTCILIRQWDRLIVLILFTTQYLHSQYDKQPLLILETTSRH